MAIDTAAKRSSALDHEEIYQFAAPLPDGTIGQGDRQHSIWSYSGILAAAPGGAVLISQFRTIASGIVMRVFGRVN